MRSFEHDGLRLAYDVVGEGLPVILHTGAGGDSSMWRDAGYVDALGGYMVVLFDHRGHGASDTPTDPRGYLPEHHAADVVALADHLGLDRFAFWGYSAGARFGFTETRLGILPAVISPFVIAKIGESHARALFPGGRRFDAVRAQRIGLVHEVVEGEAALDGAVDSALADILAAGPTAARAAKAIVREVRGLGHGASKWHTARIIARQRTSDEAQEGFRAFTEKRKPGWAPPEDAE